MELFQLRYFMEVARQQHVRRSAEALHVSQPAVSAAIHRLESEMGVPLFVHGGRGMKLTPYGKFLYDEMLPICESLDSLSDRIKELETREAATLKLNVFAAWFIVMEALLEFRKIDEGLNVQVVQTDFLEEADITISTVRRYRARKRRADGLCVLTEPVYLAVPNIPRFHGRLSVSLKEVKDVGFIQLTKKSYIRGIYDEYCAEAGIYPRTAFESDDPSAVRSMLCSGMGVGFWPEFSWGGMQTFPGGRQGGASSGGQSRMLLLRVEKPECSRDIVIERNSAAGDNVHARVFFDYLSRYMELRQFQNLRSAELAKAGRLCRAGQ